MTSSQLKILIFSLAFTMPLLTALVSDFNGLYGQDSYAYLEMSRVLSFFDAEASKSFFWPIIYPLLGKLIMTVFGYNAAVLQLVSMISFAFIIVIVFDLLITYTKTTEIEVFIYCVLFVLLSPYMLRFSMLVMSDMLTSLFVLLTFKYALKPIGFKSVCISVIFSVLSISTRYASLFLLIAPLGYVIVQLIKQKKFSLLVGFFISGLLAFIPHIYFKGINPDGLLNHGLFENWSILNFTKSSFILANSLDYSFDIPNLLFNIGLFIHPAYCFIGIFLLVIAFIFRSKLEYFKGANIVLAALLTYLIFLSGIPFQNKRFFILAFPLLTLLLFPAYKYIRNNFKFSSVALVVVGICQIFLSAFTIQKPILMSRTEARIANLCGQFNSMHLPIFNSGMEGPLKYYLEDKVTGLYRDKIDSLPGRFVLVIDSIDIASQKNDLLLSQNVKRIFEEGKMTRRVKLSGNLIGYEFSR